MTERRNPTFRELGRRSIVRNLTTNGTIVSTEEAPLWVAAQRFSAFKGNSVVVFQPDTQLDTTGKPLNPDHSLRIVVQPSSGNGRKPNGNVSWFLDDLDEIRTYRNTRLKSYPTGYEATVMATLFCTSDFIRDQISLVKQKAYESK